jgi:hypothetical protein
VRDTFHKVFANAGGMYVEIDTAADPHYNATGLQRVHRAGVGMSPLSDSTAADRAYGPKEDHNHIAMSPGIQWMDSTMDSTGAANPHWISLGDFVNPNEPKPRSGAAVVNSTDLSIQDESPQHVAFSLTYHLSGKGDCEVVETYSILGDQVDGMCGVSSDNSLKTRVSFPSLVNDGSRDLAVETSPGRVVEQREDGILTWQVTSPPEVSVSLLGPRIPCHNGFMQAAAGDLPDGIRQFIWRISLERAK